MKLEDKVVWITGASSGIGAACAEAFCAAGAKVIISARREELLQAVRERCSVPERVTVCPMDVTDHPGVCGGERDLFWRVRWILRHQAPKKSPGAAPPA